MSAHPAPGSDLEKLKQSIGAIESAGLEINPYGIVVMPDEDYPDFQQWLHENHDRDGTRDDGSPHVCVMSQSEYNEMMRSIDPPTPEKVQNYITNKANEKH